MKPWLISIPFFVACLLVGCDRNEPQAGQSGEPAPSPQSDYELPVDPKFAAALSEFYPQCPDDYSAVVIPLPEQKDFEKIPTAELLKMLESWNPSLREEAAAALAERGPEMLPVLRKATHDDNWMVRAGAATALDWLVKWGFGSRLPKHREFRLTPQPEDREVIEGELTAIIDDFIRLAGDERLEVRVAALDGLDSHAPQTSDAAMAVLKLFSDPDLHLSQDAMMCLSKRFPINVLEQEEVIPLFKSAFEQSMPRGKGYVVKLIEQMNPEVQRRFVPELISLLKWKPRRDTMFTALGRDAALSILTDLKETEVVALLPAMMAEGRGPGFDLCCDSAVAFGKEALPILPQLEAILDDLKTNGRNAKSVPYGFRVEPGIVKLEQTINQLKSL